jgi:hypothetical protein
MSDIVYGDLLILIEKTVNGKPEGAPERYGGFVDFFEVDGGADRKIEISSALDFHISSEFEQARIYKNIILYMRPGGDTFAKLLDLSKSGKKDFFMGFTVLVWSDTGHFTRQMEIQSFATNFAGTPIPVGKTPPLLKMKMMMNRIQLNIGRFDEKRKVMYLESI